MSEHECRYDDGICRTCHENDSKPDNSELIAEIDRLDNIYLDNTNKELMQHLFDTLIKCRKALGDKT